MPQDILSSAEDSTAPSDTAPSDTSEDESAQPDWLDEMMAEDDVEDDRLTADQAPVSGEDDLQSEDEFPDKFSPQNHSPKEKLKSLPVSFPTGLMNFKQRKQMKKNLSRERPPRMMKVI